ncbi:hypothetical protein A3Q56_02289 [Intoshia linei]|uniref:Myb-like domain-containing protein n=1 Tax=Intoshia linei TaxID=1819745 RepID=A0A177B730_9BILA|nr:hypothetical protein A3Q56_02289 [Intoshia linei]
MNRRNFRLKPVIRIKNTTKEKENKKLNKKLDNVVGKENENDTKSPKHILKMNNGNVTLESISEAHTNNLKSVDKFNLVGYNNSSDLQSNKSDMSKSPNYMAIDTLVIPDINQLKSIEKSKKEIKIIESGLNNLSTVFSEAKSIPLNSIKNIATLEINDKNLDKEINSSFDSGSETEKIVVKNTRKRKMTEVALKEPIRFDKTTIKDLIYQYPIDNPMRTEKETETQLPNKKNCIYQSEQIETPQNKPLSSVPKLKFDDDGNIVLDEQSLIVDKPNPYLDNNSKPVIFEDAQSQNYFKKKKHYSARWNQRETEKFYLALSMIGTDFERISHYFKNRNRSVIKIKFKKEEKINGHLIDSAIKRKIEFDGELLTQYDEPVEVIKKDDKKRSRSKKLEEKLYKVRKFIYYIQKNRLDETEDEEESMQQPELNPIKICSGFIPNFIENLNISTTQLFTSHKGKTISPDEKISTLQNILTAKPDLSTIDIKPSTEMTSPTYKYRKLNTKYVKCSQCNKNTRPRADNRLPLCCFCTKEKYTKKMSPLRILDPGASLNEKKRWLKRHTHLMFSLFRNTRLRTSIVLFPIGQFSNNDFSEIYDINSLHRVDNSLICYDDYKKLNSSLEMINPEKDSVSLSQYAKNISGASLYIDQNEIPNGETQKSKTKKFETVLSCAKYSHQLYWYNKIKNGCTNLACNLLDPTVYENDSIIFIYDEEKEMYHLLLCSENEQLNQDVVNSQLYLKISLHNFKGLNYNDETRHKLSTICENIEKCDEINNDTVAKSIGSIFFCQKNSDSKPILNFNINDDYSQIYFDAPYEQNYSSLSPNNIPIQLSHIEEI